jgi:hypothetical protein
MTVRRAGVCQALVFGGGFLTGCALVRLAMRGLPPAARKIGAPT